MTSKFKFLPLLACAALFPIASVTVSAADGDKAKPADSTAKPDGSAEIKSAIEAHKPMVEARDAHEKALKPFNNKMAALSAKYAAATTDADKKSLSAEMAVLRTETTKETASLEKTRKETTKTFNKAFAATDWNNWDVKADRAALEDGLKGAADGGMSEDRDACVVKTADWAVAHLGESTVTSSLIANGYAASLRAGEKDRAIVLKKLKDVAKYVKGDDLPAFSIDLGDAQLIAGELEGAIATFKSGYAAQKGDAPSEIKMRADLVGKTAPEINSKVWLGGEAKSLSSLKGKVVVLNFLATRSETSRAALPALAELAHDCSDKAVQVLSIVKQESSGALPNNKAGVAKGPCSQWEASKEALAGSDKGLAEYMAHIRSFYAVADLGYPFVVSSVAEQDRYQFTGIPCFVVLDADGKIVYIQNGFGSNLNDVKCAVDQALKPKVSGEAAKS